MRHSRVPWPIAVSFLIRPLGESFTLPEVYALADPLRRGFPNNQHFEAKFGRVYKSYETAGALRLRGADIDAARLIARKPLSENAKRAGWIGATIDLQGMRRAVWP